MALDWETIARTYVHEDAMRILEALDVSEAAYKPEHRRRSPRRLTVDLDKRQGDLPRIAYHMRALFEKGLLVEAGTRPARGAVEHYYRLAPKARRAKARR